MDEPKFGDIVETNFRYSEKQLKKREFGQSQVSFSGNPAVYHPGDTVNLPYGSGETSTIYAIGLAWMAAQSGIGPG